VSIHIFFVSSNIPIALLSSCFGIGVPVAAAFATVQKTIDKIKTIIVITINLKSNGYLFEKFFNNFPAALIVQLMNCFTFESIVTQ